MRLSLAFLIGGAVLVATATTARADEDNALRLTWSAPAGCPSSDDVRSATLRNASPRNAKNNADGTLEADARVEQLRDASWRVRLRTRRGANAGEREIAATTCNGVADATAVILALALVPPGSAPEEQQPPIAAAATTSTDAPTATTPATATPRDATTSASEPSAASKKTSSGPHLFAFGASGAADASTLPATTIGGGLTLAWTPGRARVEIDGRKWASQSQDASGQNGAAAAGARFSMTSIGARGCFAAVKSGNVLDVSPCVGGDVHLISAPGYGATGQNYSASAEWTTITGGALGRVSLTHWLAIRSRIEAFVPLTRPTFVVENAGTVHRPPSIGAAASFGVEVLFLNGMPWPLPHTH